MDAPATVTMTCMTTKKSFDVEDPPVIQLKNGRYAYRVPCPWEGKNGKKLTAFKFCSAAAYQAWQAKSERVDEATESEHSEVEGEIDDSA